MKFVVTEKFADNGEHSHYEAIHKETGSPVDLKMVVEDFEAELTKANERNKELEEFKQMVKDYHTTFPAKEQFRAIELLGGNK